MLDWIDPQTKALIKDQAKGQLRHAMTELGAVLASYGVFANGSDQQAQFITVATGIAIAGSGHIWSWWQKTGKGQMQARLVDIAAAAELKRQQAAAAHVAAVDTETRAKLLLAQAQAGPALPSSGLKA